MFWGVSLPTVKLLKGRDIFSVITAVHQHLKHPHAWHKEAFNRQRSVARTNDHFTAHTSAVGAQENRLRQSPFWNSNSKRAKKALEQKLRNKYKATKSTSLIHNYGALSYVVCQRAGNTDPDYAAVAALLEQKSFLGNVNCSFSTSHLECRWKVGDWRNFLIQFSGSCFILHNLLNPTLMRINERQWSTLMG